MPTKHAVLMTGVIVLNKKDMMSAVMGKTDGSQHITSINCDVGFEVSVTKEKTIIL